jgi:broad specificity phosphatase PhoE
MKIIFVRHGLSTQNIAYEKGEKYNPNNIVLTERGKEQAIITGKYLKEIYSNFDLVYCSPLPRCRQTCNLICNEIKYDKDIIIKKSLRETYSGSKFEGMSKKEMKEYIAKNKELTNIDSQLENEKNPYEKVKLSEKGYEIYGSDVGGYSRKDAFGKLKKFLKNLKKQNKKQILVVTHGGIIEMISKIVTKIDIFNNDLIISSIEQSSVWNDKPKSTIEFSNCCILGLLLHNNKYELVIPINNLHLENMNMQNINNKHNIYFFRHSERLDNANFEEWKTHERYNENKRETPITKNGIDIAKNTILDLLKHDNREVENIYSSPSERCVQTALEIQNQIFKKTGNLIKIKIEYGLVYFINKKQEDINFSFTNNKFKIKKEKIIDDYMTLENISKRYNKENFDIDYEPIFLIKQINETFGNFEEQLNQRIETVYGLYKKINSNKINICCTHGEIICETIIRFALQIDNFENLIPIIDKYFNPNDYCFWLKLKIDENNKIKLLEHKNKDIFWK